MRVVLHVCLRLLVHAAARLLGVRQGCLRRLKSILTLLAPSCVMLMQAVQRWHHGAFPPMGELCVQTKADTCALHVPTGSIRQVGPSPDAYTKQPAA